MEKTISLKGYEWFEKDTTRAFMELNVVKVYPAESVCSGRTKYANLYIARRRNGQELYVFEYCQPVSDLIKDTTGRYIPLIDSSTILHERPEKVIIYVPADFSIPAGSKYVFAPITILIES
jgi:hypothetical protein